MKPTCKKCDWSRCEAAAAKHAKFGNRSFGAGAIVAAPGQNYTAIHRDLCAKHVEEVRVQYLDFAEFELGQCPSCDR